MPNQEIELNPVEFITIGTVGPKGKRLFHLQAGQDDQLVSLIIEKEQARALGEAIEEMLEDLDKRFPAKKGSGSLEYAQMNMELRDPIEPMFRVSQMGLGYDEQRDMVVLVAQELMSLDEDISTEETEPSVVRLWCKRTDMRALGIRASEVVRSGRPDPRQNGRLVFYWT
jgi:uncharacterized repeat protein (TIGR03847 family)